MSVPGLVNERTALSWQRTALSLVAAAAAMARLTVGRLGGAAVVTMAGAVVLTLWILVESAGRYRIRRPVGPDSAAPSPPAPGGRAPTVLAAVTALIALTELAALLRS